MVGGAAGVTNDQVRTALPLVAGGGSIPAQCCWFVAALRATPGRGDELFSLQGALQLLDAGAAGGAGRALRRPEGCEELEQPEE